MINVFHNAIFIATNLSYLLILVAFSLLENDSMIIELLAFTLTNLVISFAYLTLIHRGSGYSFFSLFYLFFWMVYIVKGAVQIFIGLEDDYILRTIRLSLTESSYGSALVNVTLAHFFITLTLLFLNRLSFRSQFKLPRVKVVDFSNRSFFVLVVGCFAFIVLSTAIMLSLGVAVMGAEGVSLPYKLSGVLFYGRLLVIPFLLLLCMQSAIEKGAKRQFNICLVLLLLLSLSDIVVRASKGPLFILVLQILALYFLMGCNNRRLEVLPSKVQFFSLFTLGLLLWPIVEVYRDIKVGNFGAALELSSFSSDSLGVNIILNLFQRLLGFLQYAGILADSDTYHSVSLMLNYPSIGHYYTNHFLGYTHEGHLSSPSLMGTALLFGGEGWLLVLVAFVVSGYFLWVFTHLLGPVEIVTKSMMVPLILNVIMAGTIDFFLFDWLLLFALAVSSAAFFFLVLTLDTQGSLDKK